MKKVDTTGRDWLSQRLNMQLLKWMTMALPILFLVTVDILRHTFFFGELHNIPGFLFTYSVIAIGVVLFSFTVFRVADALQSKVNEQNRWLSAINVIAVAASQKLRLDELLETGLDQVMKVMKADACLICLVDETKEEHSAVCHRGFSADVVRNIQRAKLRDDPIAEEVVRTGRPVIMERVFDDPRVAEAGRREGIKSAISAPLLAEGEVNGILAVATRTERHFTPADEDLLKAVGGQLGMAIRNAVLFERSERKNRELAALATVGKAVSSSLDLDDVLRLSLDTVLEVTAVDAAEIWLTDGDSLVIQLHRGAHPEAFVEASRFSVGEGFPGIVAQTRAPLLIHDLPSDPRFLRQQVVNAGYHTFCALPLVYRDKLVGVMGVAALSSDALRNSGDLPTLEAIGERIAVAIANAELYRRIQRLSVLQERERISREMHDGMAQVLGFVNTKILALKKLHSDGRFAEASGELQSMQVTIQQLYADVREGILGLRTASHEEGGLQEAMKEYVERYQDMSGIPVHFEPPLRGEGVRISSAAEVQLIRIVQEALTNVRKHARATAARVTLAAEGGELRCEVADNGWGFDPANRAHIGWPRFGLQTMRERAESIGGSFAIEARPGHGTKVVIRVPLADKACHR